MNQGHKFTPLLIGRGRAGKAIENAFSILRNLDPEFQLTDAHWLSKQHTISEKISQNDINPTSALVGISNPNALHFDRIMEAAHLGIPLILAEKPLCVRKEDLLKLKGIKSQVAIFHVYRQMWGPQTLRAMIENGELGNLVTIEGRYWHSSVAESSLKSEKNLENWKNNPELSGPYDVLLDVGTHWLDIAFFLSASKARTGSLWLSYQNAEKPHRDTHIHLTTEFENGCRALGSVSKIAHGFTDYFEINAIGTKAAASWTFSRPDEIYVGRGRQKNLITRTDLNLGSRQPAFRSLGWIEGYIEIIRQSLYRTMQKPFQPYPDLESVIPVMEHLFELTQNRNQRLS